MYLQVSYGFQHKQGYVHVEHHLVHLYNEDVLCFETETQFLNIILMSVMLRSKNTCQFSATKY
jgi:hypothetical protein